MKTLFTTLFVILIAFSCGLFVGMGKEEKKKEPKQSVICKPDVFTEDYESLYWLLVESFEEREEIKCSGFSAEEFALLFTRVAIRESYWNLSSDVCLIGKNPFGMRPTGSKFTDQKRPVYAGHSAYPSWSFACKDIARWSFEAGAGPPLESETLIDWLKRRSYNSANPNYYFEIQNFKL